MSTGPRAERAYLVGAVVKNRIGPWSIEDSIAELAELARSVGAVVLGSMSQRLNKPTHHYVGSGKLGELRQLVNRLLVDTLICDDELTPTQQRNLENALSGVKVIDRTALILDVFGRQARTHEGRLQVDLAQHQYLMPRLAGQWSHLQRLGGGIGTRGPGETQIETDRRLVRGRVQRITKALENVRRHRGQYRARRREQGFPIVGLVGYTNAGKSTLLNRLTGASVEAEDRLFSTLDPVTRRLRLPSGTDALVTDTVGFIQKLPPTIVAAFRATLEEIEEASLILQVVDITHPNAAAQAMVVDNVLADLEVADKPRILVLNKTDLIVGDGDFRGTDVSQAGVPSDIPAVFTSASTGGGLDDLLAEIDRVLSEQDTSLNPDVIVSRQ